MGDQRSLVVAGLRVTPHPWDKAYNTELLIRYTRQAATEGAGLVVTPEGFVEGYVWNDEAPKAFTRDEYFALGEPADGPLMDRLRDLASELRIHLAVGFAERRGDEMFNSFAILSPEGLTLSLYAKTHTAGDEPLNTRGTEFPVVDTAFGRWGSLVCMDRQLPETSRILALKGAALILVPAWGMTGELNDAMMRIRAYENGVHLVFVHPRRCLVIDPTGTIVAQDRGGGDEIVSARITLQPPGRGPISRRRPEIYGDLLLPSPGVEPGAPFATAL